jgi:DNA polymerase-4
MTKVLNAEADFPQAIIHVDGDAFFAACEVAKDPSLRGKPVVTGLERGIVSAATYEAKKLGITRGVSLKEVRQICPSAVILASDYKTYGIYSRRMYAIVRRYTPYVEEYGIDECFADITNASLHATHSYEQIARLIQEDLFRELRITFSIGLAPTKVLAKVGSKWEKPNGLTAIGLSNRTAFLRKTPLRQVWGIGPSQTLKLFKLGFDTALDFASAPEGHMRDILDRPHRAIWKELRGEVATPLNSRQPESPHSIQTTRTFTPPSSDAEFITSQLSKNIETSARKARRLGRAASHVHFHLKTQSFEYQSGEVDLPHPSSSPQDIVPLVLKKARALIHPGIEYRATGITLSGFYSSHALQLDLWQESEKSRRTLSVEKELDVLHKKYGTALVYLGSSTTARAHEIKREARINLSSSIRPLIQGLGHKRLPLPVLGEVN